MRRVLEEAMMVDSSVRTEMISAGEIRELCGDVLDWKVAAILALRPSPADVAAAVAWAGGDDELGQAGRPLGGVAAQVYDLLRADEYEEEDP